MLYVCEGRDLCRIKNHQNLLKFQLIFKQLQTLEWVYQIFRIIADYFHLCFDVKYKSGTSPSLNPVYLPVKYFT